MNSDSIGVDCTDFELELHDPARSRAANRKSSGLEVTLFQAELDVPANKPGQSIARSSTMRPHVALCALLLTFTLSACFGRATYRWQEEVLLHDGRVIVIERSLRTGEVPVELGQRPGESDYTLVFKATDGKAVTWEAGKSFKPMILDFANGTPYVVARGSTGPDYERLGCPKPPYFIFRWADGRWQRIDYEQLPREIRRMNLSASVTGDEAAFAAVTRGKTTVEDVKKSHRWLSPHYKEVREDAPNPCATWRDEYRYLPKK